MGWWFGRKSALADARPFVPAWLTSDSAEVGFARSYSEQFQEVFQRNPVGQRSVRLVSGMLGSLTIEAIEGEERAAALVNADGLLESITANLLLHGCLCAADRRRSRYAGGAVPPPARANECGQRRARLAGRLSLPCCWSGQTDRQGGCARADTAGAHQGAPPA